MCEIVQRATLKPLKCWNLSNVMIFIVTNNRTIVAME